MTTRAKPNEPLPYYKWYWRDWRGSRAVQKMTALERGIYRELMDEQWRSGALKNDPEWLAEAAMCTADELAQVWQVVSKCFPPIEGTDGRLLANERLEAERTATDRERVNRAIAGRLGGLAKAKQVLAGGKQVPYSSSRAEQSSSTNAEAGASAASGPVGPSASADQLATPDEMQAVFAALRTFGQGGR